MLAATIPRVRRGWDADDLRADGAGLTFIQVARGMHFDGTALELVDLAPTMPYVASSPPTVLGHISTGAFLDLWASGRVPAGDAAACPCVLSLADPTIVPLGDALLLVTRPRIHGTGLQYSVTLIGGALPSSSGSCVLYVNAGPAPVERGASSAPPRERER